MWAERHLSEEEIEVTKKAFCVGINDYPYEDSDLNGCVNDARAWAELLVEHFDFPEENVRILTDSEATKANVVAGIRDLLEDAASGDVLVFTNSSHGTYVPDTDGDEYYDEALCPYDTDENLLLDDEMREMFSGLPEGVSLTVISDSCHSGTVTRAPADTPDDRRIRFLSPKLRGAAELEDPFRASPKRAMKHPQSEMKEVLLSGCTATEYSYDAMINGDYHGAMTYHAIKALRDAGYRLTYSQLHTRVNHMLEKAGYDQHPRLEGNQRNKERRVFS